MNSRRVLGSLSRFALSRGILIRGTTSLRLSHVRSVSLTVERAARSSRPEDDEEVINEPVKFSTSKASHRTWKVHRSMGSQFQRPWWKVLPISLVCTAFLLWCALRKETEVDAKLEKGLFEHLPGLLPDKEEDQDQNKSS